jgi:hypothetical protein
MASKKTTRSRSWRPSVKPWQPCRLSLRCWRSSAGGCGENAWILFEIHRKNMEKPIEIHKNQETIGGFQDFSLEISGNAKNRYIS